MAAAAIERGRLMEAATQHAAETGGTEADLSRED
jgi:hypothetical protein